MSIPFFTFHPDDLIRIGFTVLCHFSHLSFVPLKQLSFQNQKEKKRNQTRTAKSSKQSFHIHIEFGADHRFSIYQLICFFNPGQREIYRY